MLTLHKQYILIFTDLDITTGREEDTFKDFTLLGSRQNQFPDGDGKTDPAVWRQNAFGTQQAWFFIKQSRDGIRYEPWGLSTDGIGRLW